MAETISLVRSAAYLADMGDEQFESYIDGIIDSEEHYRALNKLLKDYDYEPREFWRLMRREQRDILQDIIRQEGNRLYEIETGKSFPRQMTLEEAYSLAPKTRRLAAAVKGLTQWGSTERFTDARFKLDDALKRLERRMIHRQVRRMQKMRLGPREHLARVRTVEQTSRAVALRLFGDKYKPEHHVRWGRWRARSTKPYRDALYLINPNGRFATWTLMERRPEE